MSVLRRLAETAGLQSDSSVLLEMTVKEVAAALSTSRCFFYQVDDRGFIRLFHEFVASGIPAIGGGSDILTPESYLARQTSLVVQSDDILHDSRFAEPLGRRLLQKLNILSALVVPVASGGKLTGLFGIHQCDHIRKWSDRDLEFMETVSALLARFLQSSRVFAQQESQADVLARMNEDLSRLYVEIAAKDTQIDRFMHLISHDLRAPVVAIQGLVDLLKASYQNDPPDSKPRRYLELILHSAEQITQLTGALLEYARLGQSSLSLSEVETDSLVREIWQRCAISFPDAELEIFGALPVVHADLSKLVQVFQNLIENAIKYRQPGGKLLVDVTCQETEEHWQFAVNDNGIGFHPSQGDKLFDLFARLKEVRTKPGSGIGLASVMEIARLHGGTAWAVGHPGKGSTFYFSIAKKIIAPKVL